MNKSKNMVQQGNNLIKHANNKFTPLVHKHKTTTLQDSHFISILGRKWDHFLHGNNISLHNFQIIIGFAFLVDNV
jgi:hypothetical protein